MTADCGVSCVDSRCPCTLAQYGFEVDLQLSLLVHSLCVLTALGGPVAISKSRRTSCTSDTDGRQQSKVIAGVII